MITDLLFHIKKDELEDLTKQSFVYVSQNVRVMSGPG